MKAEIHVRISKGKFYLSEQAVQTPMKTMRSVNIHLNDQCFVPAILIDGNKFNQLNKGGNSLFFICQDDWNRSKKYRLHLKIFLSIGDGVNCMCYVLPDDFEKLVAWCAKKL